MSDKKYKLTNRKALAIVVFVLIAGLGTIVSVNALSHEAMLLGVIAAFVLGLILAIVSAVCIKELYIRVLDDGFELIKGKTAGKYSFSEFAGSNVVRHYTNGIYTGTTREIKVIQLNGKVGSIKCNNLSKDQFAELVSYLSAKEFKENHDINVSEDYFKQERFFSINRDSIIKAVKSKVTLWVVIFAVLAVGALATLIIYLIDDNIAFAVIAILVGIFAIIVLFCKVISEISQSKKIKTIPDHISIDEYTFAVGDKSFRAEDILTVSMVPSSYEILTRDMVLILKDGSKVKFNFGTSRNTKGTYEKYDELFSTVKMWCIVKNINFMSILG